MNPSLVNLTAQQLRRAATIQERIESLAKELNRVFGTPARSGNGEVPRRNRRVSAAGRANIAAAARARWARANGEKRPVRAVKKAKRRMSVVARAKLAAIAKARWRKVKAQGRRAL